MTGRFAAPKSRAGKSQILVFLEPADANRLYRRAERRDISIQQALGESVNAALEANGRKPLYSPVSARVFRRKRGASAARSEGKAPDARVGKKSVGGWYETEVRDAAKDLAKSLSTDMAGVVRAGMDALGE